MKKVLLIGNIWPYHNSAGICIYAIARYLPEFGWEPIVLTTPLPEDAEPGYRVIEVPYRDIVKAGVKKLGLDTSQSVKKQLLEKLNVKSKKSLLDLVFRLLNEILTYPDAHRGWKMPALKKGAQLIEQENIRAIITDNPPVLAQLIAKDLKQKYHIPWIVYFSHLWSQNNGYSFSSLRRAFDLRLERKILAHTDLMICHSGHQAAKQRTLMKGKPVISVFEGFPPDAVNDPPDPLTEKLTITYTGTFAPGLREPEMLLCAMENLINRRVIDRNKVEVRFYGTKEVWIDSEIEQHGLSDVVRQYGRVPMTTAQANQRESHVLYNPKWDDPEDPGIYAGKFFEYLAARRPILATGKYLDVVDEMLADIGSGVSALSVEDTEQALEEMYREFLVEGAVKFRGDVAKLAKSSHRDLAKIFAGELDRLTT